METVQNGISCRNLFFAAMTTGIFPDTVISGRKNVPSGWTGSLLLQFPAKKGNHGTSQKNSGRPGSRGCGMRILNRTKSNSRSTRLQKQREDLAEKYLNHWLNREGAHADDLQSLHERYFCKPTSFIYPMCRFLQKICDPSQPKRRKKKDGSLRSILKKSSQEFFVLTPVSGGSL